MITTLGANFTENAGAHTTITGLTTALEANSTYEVMATLEVTTNGITGGYGIGWAAPAGGYCYLQCLTADSTTPDTSPNLVATTGASAAPAASANGNGATKMVAIVHGIVTTSSAGDFTFTGKAEAGGDNLTVYSGSRVVFRKLA